MSRFDGVVLCGGGSRRMGRDKALVEIEGVAMARRVADALAGAGAATVRAVGGDAGSLAACGVASVADAWPSEGPLGGLVTALERVGGEALVAVLACDLVHPDPTAVVRLVERLERGGSDAVVPCVDGRPQWMHAVWRRRVGGVLRDVFSSGERSLFGAVGGLDLDFAAIDEIGVVATAFTDADGPGDLPRSGLDDG